MITVGIVGGTGYTGVELLRLLALHSGVEVALITSRSEAGRPVADLFPSLRGHCDLVFEDPEDQRLAECDLVFFATPNAVAMHSVGTLVAQGVKVVDLSADFRLQDREVWEHWYGTPHTAADLLQEAVYGLPEVNREAIRQARLVANPGCYATTIQLGFLPMIEAGVVDPSRLIADGKSGASGGGRQARMGMLLGEAGESFRAYAASGHRHLPEIEQGLRMMRAEMMPQVTFVPHLVPMVRGIEATLYAEVTDAGADFQSIYEARFWDEPFVDVMPWGSLPETRSVRGENTCRMALHRQPGQNRIIVSSVTDNLVKGAAGQAIQNMNLMCGLDEREGLKAPALLP
ncbi:N-acetyl-gamma-glutamyl-phosphate reductase [Halomonadaceae bacterium KBTZ08]